jgi:hypothetical protein
MLYLLIALFHILLFAFIIQGIVYRPAKDFHGSDLLVISVDDMGNNGYGLLCAGSFIILNLCI